MHGGRSEVVIIGHSAGAHIAAMLCICPEYLEEVQLDPQQMIKGLVTMSGVFSAKRFSAHPIFRYQFMHPVFGDDSSRWDDCFPLELGQKQLRNGQALQLPPTLITTSQYEFSLQSHADDWDQLLAKAGVKMVRKIRASGTFISSNHMSIIFGFNRPGSPSQEQILPAIVSFCREVVP
jgi:acetyl esterase/lipase